MELKKTQSNADTAESVNELTFDELGKVAGAQGMYLKFTFSTVFVTKID
jgi:hypothetical protein